MYTSFFSELLAELNRSDVDPRHVEGFLRLQYGCLDALKRSRIIFELTDGGPDGSILDAIDADPAGAETLAVSYGL